MRTERLKAVIVAIGVVGCTHLEGATPARRVDDPNAPNTRIRQNSVVYLSADTVDRIAVELVDSRRSPTGTLEVIAVLRNRTDHPQQIEGRVHFLDERNVATEPPSAWQRVHLPPNSIHTLSERSGRIDGTVAYYVELR